MKECAALLDKEVEVVALAFFRADVTKKGELSDEFRYTYDFLCSLSFADEWTRHALVDVV